MSTTKLRLGPLPKTENVKLTFTCPASLKADLERYAALHSKTYGADDHPAYAGSIHGEGSGVQKN